MYSYEEFANYIKNFKTKKSVKKLLYAATIINFNIKKFIQKRKSKHINNFKNNLSKINKEFLYSPIE